jgi:hypothetical protein
MSVSILPAKHEKTTTVTRLNDQFTGKQNLKKPKSWSKMAFLLHLCPSYQRGRRTSSDGFFQPSPVQTAVFIWESAKYPFRARHQFTCPFETPRIKGA